MNEYKKRTKATQKNKAIKLLLKKAREGKAFGDVLVYIKTSDPSGNIYVRYDLCYEQNDFGKMCNIEGQAVPLTWYNGANNGSNRSNYRIKTAMLCLYENDGFTKLYDVLQAGEISLAVKEIKKDGSIPAGDFVGGFHGDEIIETVDGVPQVFMRLDGVEVDLSGRSEMLLEGDVLTFDQSTVINRCNTPNENIFRHMQKFTFDTFGVHDRQQLEFLTSDYEERGGYLLDNSNTYLQMFTFYRVNSENENDRICDKLSFYDETGKKINEFDTSSYKKGDYGFAGLETQKENTAVEYAGEKGIYALAGFKINDGSVVPHTVKIMIRTFGDNKWYSSFRSPNAGGQPKKGDIWSMELLYYIDCNFEK